MRRHLVQRAAREHHRAADRRAVGAPPELGKDQVAAVIVAVEIDRDGEAAVLRPGIDVVAVAEEMPAQRAVVAGHEIAVHARRPELEIALHRRQQAAHDLLAQCRTQLGDGDHQVLPPLEAVIDHGRGLAVLVEQEARIFAAHLVVEPDQQVAQREIEHPRHDERRRGQRHARTIRRPRADPASSPRKASACPP